MLSSFSYVWFFVTLWIVDHKAPLSMGFSRQEYWSGWPCSPARNFPEPGIEPTSLVAPADFLPLSYWGSPSQTSLVTQTNLENILKSRDITTCQYSQTFFLVVMYGCENWSIKKSEDWRIDALNCDATEDSWESLGLQGDQTRKSTLNIHWKDWCWNESSNILATWLEELTHWKIPWFGERLEVKGEGGGRGWDGWIASPPQWIWGWENSSK